MQGMYRLPQSGLLVNELLEKQLNKHGYRQSKLVPGLWKHNTWPVQFTLVVDNFGVKYIGEEHASHLKWALEKHYTLTCDWTGTNYISITLDWNYPKRQVHLSMPNYVTKALNNPNTLPKMSICTVPLRPNSVQSQTIICNAGIENTPIR